jgi:hypothetical protein
MVKHALIFIISSLLFITTPVSGLSKNYTIAVVQDGPSYDEALVELIKPELQHMLREGDQVVFKTSPDFNAQWKPDNFRKVIGAAMRDRQVNYILSPG